MMTAEKAAGCSCQLRVTGEALVVARRVLDGLVWRVVYEKAAGCGETPCESCAAKAGAKAAAPAPRPLTQLDPQTRRVRAVRHLAPKAAAQAQAQPKAGDVMPNVVTDPAGWLDAWRAAMAAGKIPSDAAAGRAAGDTDEVDAEDWINESEDIARRRRVLDQRETDLPNPDAGGTTAAGREQLNRDWNALGLDRKREIAQGLANRATQDRAQRARLVQTALTQGIAALNRILDGEYGIVMARINRGADVEIARINGRGVTERLLITQEQQQQTAALTSNNNGGSNTGMMVVGAIVVVAVAMGSKA